MLMCQRAVGANLPAYTPSMTKQVNLKVSESSACLPSIHSIYNTSEQDKF